MRKLCIIVLKPESGTYGRLASSSKCKRKFENYTRFTPDSLYFCSYFKRKNEIIGNVSLNIEEENPSSAELGCWMDVPFWGEELGVEALQEIIRLGFEELKLKELWASHFEENQQSRRLQEKCGLRFRYKKKMWIVP